MSTAPPEVPWVPTRTLNLDDHPFILHLRTDERGQWEWALDIDPALMADKARTRQAIASLTSFLGAWFVQAYMTPGETA